MIDMYVGDNTCEFHDILFKKKITYDERYQSLPNDSN